MFLSKVIVNWRWAKDPYQLHRALWQLFPDRPQDQRDFLFRAEEGDASRGLTVLLQSVQRPQQAEVATVLASKAVNFALPEGEDFYFRLRVNPVKTIRDAQGRVNRHGEIKTCRVPLLKEEECMAWLVRKLEGAAKLKSARIEKEPSLIFHKKGISGKIQPLCFEGVLRVQSTEAFAGLVRTGIGPAKSMGCGLLSLARA